MPIPIASRKTLLFTPPVVGGGGPGQIALFDTVAGASGTVTFSNSNMNAIGAGSIASTAAARITTVPLTGLSAYWEFEVINKVSSFELGIAVYAQDTWLDNYPPNNTALYDSNGVLRPTSTDAPPVLVNGDVVGLHWKDSTKRLWWRVNNTGSYYGVSSVADDPATSTGGADLSGIASAVYPAISMNGVGDQIRFRAGSNVIYSPVAGFTVLA